MGAVNLLLCDGTDLLTALISHKNDIGGLQDLWTVFFVEWDKVDPLRIIEESGHMELQGIFSYLSSRSLDIVVLSAPLDQVFQQLCLIFSLNQGLRQSAPVFFFDFPQLGFYSVPVKSYFVSARACSFLAEHTGLPEVVLIGHVREFYSSWQLIVLLIHILSTS